MSLNVHNQSNTGGREGLCFVPHIPLPLENVTLTCVFLFIINLQVL